MTETQDSQVFVFWQSLWRLLGLHAFFTHYPQADGQTKCMNCTIGQIPRENLLDKYQERWPDFVVITEIGINSTINGRI